MEELTDSNEIVTDIDPDRYGDYEIPDYASYRGESDKPDLSLLLPESLGLSGGEVMSLGSRIAHYYRAFISLPNAHEQSAILAAVTLQPSALALEQLPVVLLHGATGCGKSDTLKLMSAFTGHKIEKSTFAALRDQINFHRFGSRDGKITNEKNYLFIYDNQGKDALQQSPAFYELLLSGYDRDTSSMSISAGIDTSKHEKTYDIFCAKVISSIFDISVDERFEEIHRRTLVVSYLKNPDHVPISLKLYDFSRIRKEIKDFWKYKPNLISYQQTSTMLRKNSKVIIKRLGDRGSEKFSLYAEYLVTMLVTGIVKELDTALGILENHLKRMDDRERSELEQVIIDSLSIEDKFLPRINVSTLTGLLSQAIRDGVIERSDASQASVKTVMTRLGYIKNKATWIKGG